MKSTKIIASIIKYVKSNKLEEANILLNLALAGSGKVKITFGDNDKSKTYKFDSSTNFKTIWDELSSEFDEYWVLDFDYSTMDKYLPKGIPSEYLSGIIYEDNNGAIDEKYLKMLLSNPEAYLNHAVLIKNGYTNNKNVTQEDLNKIQVYPMRTGETMIRFNREGSQEEIPFDLAWDEYLEMTPDTTEQDLQNSDYQEILEKYWRTLFSDNYDWDTVGNYYFLIERT